MVDVVIFWDLAFRHHITGIVMTDSQLWISLETDYVLKYIFSVLGA